MRLRPNELHPEALGFSNSSSGATTKYLYYLQLGANLYCLRWRNLTNYTLRVHMDRDLSNFRDEQEGNDNDLGRSLIYVFGNQYETVSTISELVAALQAYKEPAITMPLHDYITERLQAERQLKLDHLLDDDYQKKLAQGEALLKFMMDRNIKL